VDLLTVVAHEIGHWIGFGHDEADGESPTLMSGTLAAGARVLTLSVNESGDGESAPADGGTAYLPVVAAQAIPLPDRSLLTQQTLATPRVAQTVAEELGTRFVPVVAKPAAEEMRVFDPATGKLLTYDADGHTGGRDDRGPSSGSQRADMAESPGRTTLDEAPARGARSTGPIAQPSIQAERGPGSAASTPASSTAMTRAAAPAAANDGSGAAASRAAGETTDAGTPRTVGSVVREVLTAARSAVTGEFLYDGGHGATGSIVSGEPSVMEDADEPSRPMPSSAPSTGRTPAPAESDAVFLDLEDAVGTRREAGDDGVDDGNGKAALASVGALGAVRRLFERSREVADNGVARSREGDD
jgi:hypothetical protein